MLGIANNLSLWRRKRIPRGSLVGSGGGAVSPCGPNPVAICARPAGPPRPGAEHPPGAGRGAGTTGSAAGLCVAEAHALAGPPALGEPLTAETGCRVYVSLRSRIGSHQLAGRTSLPPDVGPAPGLGRKPHGERSPRAKHLAQYPANLPPAEPAGAAAAAAPPVFPPTTGAGLDAATPPFTLNRDGCR